MRVKDFIEELKVEKFYVLDTKKDGLSNEIIYEEGDINYVRYCYNIYKYNKLKEGSIFLYRQPQRSSKDNKFYFFGGGIIEKIEKVDDKGNVHAMIKNGFYFRLPIYKDDPRLERMAWTSKNKKDGSWRNFWNQYGMNEITKDEFLAIVGDEEFLGVNIERNAMEKEEDIILERSIEEADTFLGTYTKLGKKIQKVQKRKNKTIARKVDYNSLNKSKKTCGTLGEILIYNDEKDKITRAGIKKEVEHVAITRGDGLGYDILSYDENENEIFIEVKTTKENKTDEFYLTPKEINVCKENKEKYKLYRVYNLDMKAKKYDVEIYSGNELLNMFEFQPVSYIAKRKNV